ncbi:MAG: hypothetical protein AB1744_03230 [Candidatus Zixiibacteriota bacterium]
MDQQTSTWQTYTLISLTLVLAVFWFHGTTHAVEWETLTSLKDVRRMRVINDTVWATTSGGLLAITDPDQPGTVYDNLDGLGTTDITDIIIDAAGQKWVAGLGRLVRFRPGNSRQFLFELSNNLLGLNCIVDDGDSLWIGTDSGLVLFSKVIDGGQIQDSYHLFGSANPNPSVEDILLQGDSIWIATSSGLATADRTNPVLLNAPSAWTVFNIDSNPELGTDDIRRVVWYDGWLWIGAVSGLFVLDTSGGVTTFVLTPNSLTTAVNDLKVENDTLFVYYQWSVGAWADSQFTQPFSSLPTPPHTGTNTGQFRWVGYAGQGVYHDRDTAGVAQEYIFTGAPGNNVSGLALSTDGRLTAGFAEQKAGAYDLYDGRTWVRHDINGVTKGVTADSYFGSVWVGTHGFGIWGIRDGTLYHFDESNSTLRSLDRLPGYVITHGVASEGRFLFATSYRPEVDQPSVAIADLEALDSLSGWDGLGVADGLTNNLAVAVDAQGGRLAVGTDGGGVFVCDVSENPFARRRPSCVHYTEDDGLSSDVVRVVRFAPSGDLWVGTNFGLSRWDLDRFVPESPPGIGRDITALAFDGRGNVWVGSADGLARIDATTGDVSVFTTENSGLVSNDIRDLELDPRTGDLFIGTATGISILRSGIAQLTPDVKQVVAFPNPFIIRSDADSLMFTYAENGTVRLFSIAGELVAEFPVNTAWRGRNQKGEAVAEGVYIFVLTDNEGKVGRGKVLVIREQ